MSIIKAAESLLEKSGKPMHYMEITKFIINKCDLHGKKPHETVRARIGTNPKFIRVAEGVYGLSKWKEYKPSRFAKDISYDILKSIGKPMTLYDLGIAVKKEREFISNPKMLIKNAIYHDNRFYLEKKSGLVLLEEWGKR